MPYYNEADNAGFIGDVPTFCAVERCDEEAERTCEACEARVCQRHVVNAGPEGLLCDECVNTIAADKAAATYDYGR